jgi:hypothetical protein
MQCKKCKTTGNFEIDHHCGNEDKCNENCRFLCKVCGWLPIDLLIVEGRRF